SEATDVHWPRAGVTSAPPSPNYLLVLVAALGGGMSFLHWPWSMIGAAIAFVVLCVTVLVNIVRPILRRKHLAMPADVYFHIRGIQDGEPLGYVVQDTEGHSVKELSLPP